MKNLYLFFVVVVLPVVVFSQAGSVPTEGEIYNFDVGDTFEYYTFYEYFNGADEPTGWGGYLLDIYTNRQAYNDSIIYTYNSHNMYYKNDTVSYTYTVTFLDSAFNIYYQMLGIQYQWGPDTIDSIKVVITANDTTYKVWDHFAAGPDCDDYIDFYLDTGQFKPGFGEIDYGYYLQFPCYNYGYSYLVYYHKANGEQGGTYYDYTGIQQLANTNTIQLFPNPATNNFQLQFSSQSPDKTYLQIFNGLGQAVMERKISSSSTSINREKLSNGIYFWQLLQGDEILQRGKLILQ